MKQLRSLSILALEGPIEKHSPHSHCSRSSRSSGSLAPLLRETLPFRAALFPSRAGRNFTFAEEQATSNGRLSFSAPHSFHSTPTLLQLSPSLARPLPTTPLLSRKKKKSKMAAAAANAAAAPEFAQLYGDPDKVASEALDVLVAASPNLLRLDAGDETIKVVVDSASFEAAAKKRKADGSGAPEKKNNKQLVAVLAGGGSGHEPMAAGYVGPGCLSGAVAGDVFASPSTDAVRAALRAFEGNDAGVLLLVNNYTGDRLCFGAAAEAARAGGQKVEVVFVSDDVALLQKEEGG